MSDYLQPEFYRFNEDSLALVKFVQTKVSAAESILDLGAGSGVLGLELAQKLNPKVLQFVELQEEFLGYLENNIQAFSPASSEARFFHTSFKQFIPELAFDLIVCNPPYYLPGRGQPSLNLQRDKARTFREDGWKDLWECIKRSLKATGVAFVVIKDDPIILQEAKIALPEMMKMNVVHQKGIMILETTWIEHKEK